MKGKGDESNSDIQWHTSSYIFESPLERAVWKIQEMHDSLGKNNMWRHAAPKSRSIDLNFLKSYFCRNIMLLFAELTKKHVLKNRALSVESSVNCWERVFWTQQKMLTQIGI